MGIFKQKVTINSTIKYTATKAELVDKYLYCGDSIVYGKSKKTIQVNRFRRKPIVVDVVVGLKEPLQSIPEEIQSSEGE